MKLHTIFTFASITSSLASSTHHESDQEGSSRNDNDLLNAVIWLEPSGTLLKNFTSSGSGCQHGTIHVKEHPEPGITFSTPKLYSLTGQNQYIMDSRKFCQFVFTFDMDPGYQLALDRVSIQSYAALNDNFKATITGSQSFSGEPDTISWTYEMQGPQHDKHVSGWAPMPDRRIWSSCGHKVTLNIKMEIRLPESVENTSMVVLDLTNVVWISQKCPSEKANKINSSEQPEKEYIKQEL